MSVFDEDGAWCWFGDPKLVHHKGTADTKSLDFVFSDQGGSDANWVVNSLRLEPSKAVESISVSPEEVKDVVNVVIREIAPVQLIAYNGIVAGSFIPASVGETQINLSSYPKGIYLIKAGSEIYKIIKQ